MAEQYTIAELAAKIKERRPDLADIPNATLVGKTLAAAPELKQYLNENVHPFESPMYPGGPESRTPGQVMSDQAANVLKGIPQAITGIPSFLGEAASGIGEALSTGKLDRVKNLLKGTADAAVQPFTPVIKTAMGKPPLPESPEWAQAAEGAGAMLGAAELPNAISGAGEMGGALLQKARRLRAGGDTGYIEQQIAPSGDKAKARTLKKTAPALAQDPTLVNASPSTFDTELVNRFKNAEARVDAAHKSVPSNTVVPQDSITNALGDLHELYRENGNIPAATAIGKEWNFWADKEPQIKWDDFMAGKRRLGEAMKTNPALRRAYGILMQASENADPTGLVKPANAEYSLVKRALEDAKIDPSTGRRISAVGTPPNSPVLNAVKKYALPGGLLGGLGYGLYKNR